MTPANSLSVPPRIASVDIFRGLTMLVMIFVNELADVKGLPAWTYHMPARIDAMSYVDMVFPAFLFIMGVSLPLSVRSRLAKHPSLVRLWLHILVRSLSLMLLGLVLANAHAANSRLMPLSLNGSLWAVLALFGAALFLNLYPRSFGRSWPAILKTAGLLLLLSMLLVFRRADVAGQARWLDLSYWEILGILGWTYLATCLLYIPTRGSLRAPLFWFVVVSAFNLACAAHWIGFANRLPLYLWPWSNGAFCLLTLAGIVTSNLLLIAKPQVSRTLVFGFLLLVAGAIASPLGISKVRATPTWCLVSAGASVLLLVLLYWISDVRRHTVWAAFVHPAGANTLLTYLLPDFFYFAVGTAWFPLAWNHGAPGVLQSVVFTAVILALAALLTRSKVRLQL